MSRFKYLFVAGIIFQLLTLWFDVGTSSCELAAAPLAVGLLSAAGGTVLNRAFDFLNKQTARESMDLQKELMDYEWDKFSSPAAQVKSIAEAGLNPGVVFGQGGMRGSAPSMNAPEIAQSQQSPTDFANSVLALANAKKSGSETAGIELDNEIKRKTMDDVISAAGKQNRWTDEQINLAQQNAYNLQGQNSKLQEEINLLKKQGVKMDFDNDKLKERFDAEMRGYADKHNIDKQEFEQMVEQAPFILEKLKHESSILGVEDAVQGDYAEFNAKLGVIGKILGFLSEFIKKR